MSARRRPVPTTRFARSLRRSPPRIRGRRPAFAVGVERFGHDSLAEIEERTGCAVVNLPMCTGYYVDLEVSVVNDDRFARESLSETATLGQTGARYEDLVGE